MREEVWAVCLEQYLSARFARSARRISIFERRILEGLFNRFRDICDVDYGDERIED